MAGIDTRIVIVGLPTIARELGADVEQVIWVTQAYLLASTIGLLLIGRITDLIGRVKIYNYGFIIFTIGSAFASLSVSPGELIASRIVQGTGSAMIITNSAAILTDATPQNELGTILGINQIAFRIGSISGLTLSGIIIAIADWRALFYINIPIGIFGTIWAHKRLREISTRDTATKMDWSGFVMFTTSLTLMLLAITFLSYGGSDLFSGAAMIVVGALMMVVFIKIESKIPAPLLDLKLFKMRRFAGANLAQLLSALSWSGIVIMLSFYLQIIMGYSPLQAGLSILPLEATFIVLGPLSGRLSDKYGSRPFAVLGLLVSSVGFFLLAAITSPATPYFEIAIVFALMGAGNGMFVSPNISAIMGSVPANRRGVASGFRVTLFNVGMTASSGLAVLLISLVIPYGAFSALLQSFNPLAASQVVRDQFVGGFKIAAFAFAVINSIAIIPSFMTGSKSGEAPLESLKAEEIGPE